MTIRTALHGRPARFVVLLLHLLLWALPAAADSIWVVAHLDAPIGSLTRAEVADLFLRQAPIADLKPFPYDRTDNALREQFYRRVADMSPKMVRAHWSKQVFTGRGHPPARLEEEEITKVLNLNPYAVTYVAAGSLPFGCKLLLSLDAGREK